MNTIQDIAETPVPVRILNEYACCPRLFCLMHVDGRWEDNFRVVRWRELF